MFNFQNWDIIIYIFITSGIILLYKYYFYPRASKKIYSIAETIVTIGAGFLIAVMHTWTLGRLPTDASTIYILFYLIGMILILTAAYWTIINIIYALILGKKRK